MSNPESRLTTRGDRAFAVRAPRHWNDLPDEIRLSESVSSFKSRLKTYFICIDTVFIIIKFFIIIDFNFLCLIAMF